MNNKIEIGDFVLITSDTIEFPNENRKRANPYYLKIGEVLAVNYQPNCEDEFVDNYVVCFGRNCEGRKNVVFKSDLPEKCRVLTFK